MPRLLTFLVIWAALGPRAAAGQSGEEVPIIEAGREEEVLALFAPYRLAGDVEAGFRLMNVRIEVTHVVCELVGPDAQTASVRLDHPDYADAPDGQTASFAVRRDAESDAGRAAADAIYRAVRVNDEGGFYRRRARPPPPTERSSASFSPVRYLGTGSHSVCSGWPSSSCSSRASSAEARATCRSSWSRSPRSVRCFD